jgi:hypothetical protein
MFKYAPGQPQVQKPGVGQSALPSDIMQRIQQVQQPGKQLGGSFGPQNIKYANPMQPQNPVSNPLQYLDAIKQYYQGGRQGVRPTYAPSKQPQPQQQMQGVAQVVGQGALGGMPGQYFGIAGGGTGMPPIGQQELLQQQTQYMQQMGINPQQPSLGGINQQVGQPMTQMQTGNQGQVHTPQVGQPMTRPPAGAFGAAPQPMTRPPAAGTQFNKPTGPQVQQPMGGFGAAPPPPPPPALGMAMGGSVGMAPPNPYAQQIGQEDPRMQAMRYMQQMNFGG